MPERIPAAVQTARQVLAGLDENRRHELAKPLPLLALALERTGTPVTAEILHAHAGSGPDHCHALLATLKSPRQDKDQAPPRTYDSVVKSLLLRSDYAMAQEYQEYMEITGSNKEVALRWAVSAGLLDSVIRLHEQGTDIPDSCPGIAAAKGHLDIVKWLHEHGADIRTHNYEALRSAAGNGHLDIVKWLYEHGADIRADEELATRIAVSKGHLDIVKWLHEHGADIRVHHDKTLRIAAANDHLDMMKWLHAHGADIHTNSEEILLNTSITSIGGLDTIKWLHEQGVDIKASKILKKAFQHRQVSAALWLCKHGADYDDTAAGWMQAAAPKVARWEKRHDCCPPELEELSPHYFHPEAFRAAAAMLAKEGYRSNTVANLYAYHAAGLFRTEARILDYLEKWGREKDKQPLHDIIQMIRLPAAGRFDAQAWGDAVLKHGPKMARLVKFADRLPVPEKDAAGAGWSYTRTREKIAQFAYENGGKDPALAALCFNYEWDEDDFEKARAVTARYRRQFGDAAKPGGRIPAIALDGEAFGKPGLRFYKLPDGDVRGLFLGEFTNCCQHLGGAGAACAEHGFLSEDGGFYVVADKKTDAIVAQSWAWRGKRRELVLDSLESLPGHMEEENWLSLCRRFADAVAGQKTGITALRVGAGGATPSLNLPDAATPAAPKGYRLLGYRDSATQYDLRLP